jgi:hypothetical protein
MKISESRYRANNRYIKENIRQIKCPLNVKTDADILAKLDSVPNKTAYFKELIRKDIEKDKK